MFVSLATSGGPRVNSGGVPQLRFCLAERAISTPDNAVRTNRQQTWELRTAWPVAIHHFPEARLVDEISTYQPDTVTHIMKITQLVYAAFERLATGSSTIAEG
jgi:hypothetical protein